MHLQIILLQIDLILTFTKYHLLILCNKKHYLLKVEVKLFRITNKENLIKSIL